MASSRRVRWAMLRARVDAGGGRNPDRHGSIGRAALAAGRARGRDEDRAVCRRATARRRRQGLVSVRTDGHFSSREGLIIAEKASSLLVLITLNTDFQRTDNRDWESLARVQI